MSNAVSTREATPLKEAEVRDLVNGWYLKLDVHAPMVELLPMLAAEGLEMRFPEATLTTLAEFEGWYQGIIRKFFDEVHVMKDLDIRMEDGQAEVKLCVNWQAHVWQPPAAKSVWLGFDAYQTWIVKRSAETGSPVIATYVVDELRPMPGSATL